MIVIEPLGGLGNQLFVYGAGLAVSRRLGVPLVADLGKIQHDKKRKFELSSFRNSLEEIGFFPAPSGPAFHWHRSVASKIGNSGRFRDFHYETNPGFDARFLDVSDGSRLRGYFQSWRYVESVSRELRGELQDVRNPSKWFFKQTADLRSLGDWVGVHVRRGDYKNWPDMPVAEIYYERALGLLSDLGAAHPVVVFSDEIELARKFSIWRRFSNVLFVDNHPSAKPIEMMLLMSMASHLVIANSTFSWWSAWLGKKERRRVIYPLPWGDTPFVNQDLVPADWIGLGRLPELVVPKNS